MAEEILRELGAHGAKIERLELDVAAIRRDVAAIRETLDQTKGGVRTLIAVGGFSGAFGAALVKGLSWVKGGQ